LFDFHENFLTKHHQSKTFKIDFEADSNIESKAMTLGLLNTNYTDFSDQPIFTKKYFNYNYNINNNTQLYQYNNSNNILKNKTKKSRNQEIQFEIEQNSLIQLNIIMQMENSPLRNDYIISILSYIGFTILMFWITNLVFTVENIQM
jgi:hypothetical protein